MQSVALDNLICVSGDEAMKLWPFLKSLIEKACSKSGGSLTEGSLRDKVAENHGLLWVYADARNTPEAVAVTQVLQQPDGQTVWFIAACGGRNWKKWARPVMAIIEAAAIKNGATKMQFMGRPGWARVHPDYSVHLMEFEKELGTSHGG